MRAGARAGWGVEVGPRRATDGAGGGCTGAGADGGTQQGGRLRQQRRTALSGPLRVLLLS